MINNNNFKTKLRESSMSMYELSKLSCTPYTTINEINRDKLDINQCAAGTVSRIAAILGTSVDNILNPIDYLDGTKGKYRGIDYTWKTNGTTHILFEYNGESVDLDTGKYFNLPARIKYYNVAAGWMIKDYIEKADWVKSAEAEIERLKK